ncbi:MAG: Single-stranded-DNA-specific exonuclease RecJ [Parcubacteria group bacterium GW2011_GWC1_43_12]|nr:MAG: Single-stranded-DNA-specific exonuclease RecJ [Parcubacteria group bacterium GW2011_GWB1_42_6]KKS91719.1 MAG: Single-stranded-DNA-specific exonuclease RecJ [Parcubacteria group bacterium GW2011_GWC1_43_12]
MKSWKLKPKAPESFLKQFPEIEEKIVQLLYNRGLADQRKIDEFFSPDYDQDLHDPFLMVDMEKGAERILEAIKKKEKIVIFGDYDADGVCGSVILKTVFDALGSQNTSVYIPNRLEEGYGLNLEAIKKVSDEKADLIVTIDCGVSDVEEIELANSLGLEVIVADHHQIGKKLPRAFAIIDPFQKKDKYPFKQLAGAGVAFKLAQGLIKRSNKEIRPGWEKWLLDLVALATVADCMPLIGENRTLVRYGLIVLAQTQRIGLQELMKSARLSPTFQLETLKTNLDAYSLGFVLAPRLNAAGRVDHANLSFELLMETDRVKAGVLVERINEHNRQRQKITEKMVAEIEERLKNYDFSSNRPFAIVEESAQWSPALVGLAAGKISDRFRRPSFIFTSRDGVCRGSARSIPAFNVVDAIGKCSDLVDEFGGHPGAAGLTMECQNLPIFKERMNEIIAKSVKAEDLTPELSIDLEILPEEINWSLFEGLERFEPFGQANPKPVFLMKNLTIAGLRVLGNGQKHLRLDLKPESRNKKVFKAIGFNLAKNSGADLKVGDIVDLVFELVVDEWNGNRELQMRVVDVKKSVY